MLTRIWTWRKNRSGATAVEFSLVGIPFILMIVGTVEMALMFTAQSVLQESTYAAARLIRTGQIQNSDSGDPETMFRAAVCDFSALLIPCGEIRFSVQTVPSFTDAGETPPQFDDDGYLIEEDFDAGGPNDVVLIRVSYNYPVRTPLMQPVLSNRGGGKRSMLSTVVLRTEPYSED